MKKLIFALFILISIIISTIEFNHSTVKPVEGFFDKQEVWAHRGLSNITTPYSEELFKKVTVEGYRGVEIDVFFNLEKNRFDVTHDYNENAPTFSLEEVLKLLPSEIYIWFDFKNLSSLNKKHAIIKLNELFPGKAKNRIIIESHDWISLKTLSEANFFTSVWVNFSYKSRIYDLRLYFLKTMIAFTNFTSFSMAHDRYDDNFSKILKNNNVMLFTVNKKNKILELFKNKNVKIILTDEVIPGTLDN